ncbi:MAG: hypothetical protein ABIK53_06720 [bacterium]
MKTWKNAWLVVSIAVMVISTGSLAYGRGGGLERRYYTAGSNYHIPDTCAGAIYQ